jgi:hypothetical protein
VQVVPVCDTEHAVSPKDRRCYDYWIGHNQRILSRFPTGARDLIRSLQPFNPYKRGETGTAHPIYILNKLANQDKHRQPLQVTGFYQGGFLTLKENSRMTIIMNPRPYITTILDHDCIFAEMTVPTSQPADAQEAKPLTCITFDKNGPGAHIRVYEFLIEMHNFIRDEIVTKFEPFFTS